MDSLTERVRTYKVSIRKTVTQGSKVKTVERVRVRREKERTGGGLRFGRGNAKLDAAIFTFSLPAGHACPFARDCQSRADRETGKVKDGPDTAFRCYAASMEARHSSVRGSRWHNFELLRGKSRADMARLILESLSPYAGF